MTSERALQFIETTLDIEKLISKVQDRPALWDMTHQDYSDRIVRKQCWEEITALFSSGSDLTLDDKEKLGDILHKKWKNIRDRFARDVQNRKGKRKDGARRKAPYMYSQQLEFLRNTVSTKRTPKSAENTSFVEELHEATSASSTLSSTPTVLRTKVTETGKSRLHLVEENFSRSSDLYEKRTQINKGKEMVEDKNDNRHFLLSLEQSLASLPRYFNTSCRIEIMQCINKYESMSQQHQQPLTYLPTTHSYPGHQPYKPQRHHQSKQQPNQLQSS